MIKLNYRDGKPLHEQISSGIRELVVSGALAPNEQLPSVRELSVELTVNPNTVQRAYRNLESDGIIYSIRGKGNFVSERHGADPKVVSELYDKIVCAVRELAYLGEQKSGILNVIENIYNEGNENK